MRTAAMVARVLGILLAVPAILGLAWFYPTLTPTTKAYGIAMMLCLAIVPVMPRHWYRHGHLRLLVSVGCIVAVGLTIPVMRHDLHHVNGPDIPALVLRCIQILVIAVLGVEAVVAMSAHRST